MFQRVKAPSDVVEYLADDQRLVDQSDDAHPLAATETMGDAFRNEPDGSASTRPRGIHVLL